MGVDAQGVGWTLTESVDFGPNVEVFGGISSAASDGTIDDQAGMSTHWQASSGAAVSGGLSLSEGKGAVGQPVHTVGGPFGGGLGGGYAEGKSITGAGRFDLWPW